MKILELNFWLAPGGAERFMVDLSNELSKKHEVVVVTVKDDKVDASFRNFYKDDLKACVRYVNLGAPNGFSLKTQWAIYQVIKREKPDVVHIQSETLLKFALFAVLLFRKKNFFYETIHNDLHNGYDRGMFRFLAKILGRKKQIKYIALSKTNYESMANYYPKCCFVHIDNGRSPVCPTESFDFVQKEILSYKPSQNTMVFLHVARCSPQKNQRLLIESFNEIVEGGVDAILLVIGANFESEEGVPLKSMACSRIFFLGTKRNVSDYMLSSDVFVLSSIFEGMPITLIEASLAGIPIVSTPVCGAVDIVKNEYNGLLSADFLKESFVAVLMRMVNVQKELKKKCVEMMRDNPFTIEKCARKYVDYFKK